MRILVTGASGFIGSAVLAALLARGVDVIAVGRTRPAIEGAFHFVAHDLLDATVPLAPLFEPRVDAVLHLAWCVEHGAFWTAPANLDWVAATLRLVRAASDSRVSRFVGVGTCYEYAWPDTGDCFEQDTPLSATTLYAVAKDATRRICEEFLVDRHVSFAWCRLFFLYGQGEAPNRLVSSVARALAAGQVARCSSGLVVRDYMDVRDAGAALAQVVMSQVTGGMNIGSGEAHSVAEIVRRLGEIAGRPDLVQMGALADRLAEPPRIVADVARLRGITGGATISLDQGLADAFEFWKLAQMMGQSG